MTPRELGGWTPVEKHTHYDAAGAETGYTLVERESRIDDADRADLLALALFEAEVCSCGYHPSVTAEEHAVLFAEKVCPVCKDVAAAERIQHENDESARESMKKSPPDKPRPWDGRKSYVRLLTPEQAAVEREKQKGGDRGDKA